MPWRGIPYILKIIFMRENVFKAVRIIVKPNWRDSAPWKMCAIYRFKMDLGQTS
jgi:hypothetical protein